MISLDLHNNASCNQIKKEIIDLLISKEILSAKMHIIYNYLISNIKNYQVIIIKNEREKINQKYVHIII